MQSYSCVNCVTYITDDGSSHANEQRYSKEGKSDSNNEVVTNRKVHDSNDNTNDKDTKSNKVAANNGVSNDDNDNGQLSKKINRARSGKSQHQRDTKGSDRNNATNEKKPDDSSPKMDRSNYVGAVMVAVAGGAANKNNRKQGINGKEKVNET